MKEIANPLQKIKNRMKQITIIGYLIANAHEKC